jgi:hypothetical protein
MSNEDEKRLGKNLASSMLFVWFSIMGPFILVFSVYPFAKTFKTPMEVIFANIISPLIVAALTGLATWLWTQRQFRKKIDAAPREYVRELDLLINRAKSEGVDMAGINARAIVAARNSLKSSLVSISSNLNSEIDRLANEIGESSYSPFEELQRRTGENNVELSEIYETIQVLHRIWPSKRRQIEVEMRKVLAELGLDINGAS